MSEAFNEDPQLVRVDREESNVVVRLMLTFDWAATDFLGDCERRGFTPTSLASYDRTYRQFAEFIPHETDVSKITTDDIRRYLNTKSHLARGTRAGIEAHLASLFGWLLREGKIVRDPMGPITRTKRLPSEDLDVVTVSTDEVQKMLTVASGWSERLCMGVLVFTGCRRRAASRLRLSDYDQQSGPNGENQSQLRFREKGGKTIWKPVPDELDNLIRSAISAGVYEGDDDYLIPNLGPRPNVQGRERNHRVIYDIVQRVAEKAKVRAHTHAMRAAFAVYYLETHQRDTLALQSLMGHKSPATTQIYLRKLDRVAEMERVRDLSWGVSVGGEDDSIEGSAGRSRTDPGDQHWERDRAGGCLERDDRADSGAGSSVVGSDDTAAARNSQIAGVRFDEDRLVGAGGFEPPEAEDPLQQTPRTQPLTDALQERLEQAKSERAEDPV